MVCDKGERGGRGRERDTESKTRTPHKDVGKHTRTCQKHAQNMRKHPKTCQNVRKHAKACQKMLKHAKTCQNMMAARLDCFGPSDHGRNNWSTKLCEKVVCDKVVTNVAVRWCGEKWWVTKWCVTSVRKMVCDVWWKMVCERWSVTKSCEWDGVRKVVCGKVVWLKMMCERWCVTKLCMSWRMKDGVWERWRVLCVRKMVCDKVVWVRWCVKDSVWQSCVSELVWERWYMTKLPRLPRQTQVNVSRCHGCHAKRRWMSPSATPATWNEGGCHQVPCLPRKVPRRHQRPIRAQARHQSQPSALSATHATPATWNEGGCHQAPRLPGKVPRRHQRPIRGPAEPAQCPKCHACPAIRRWMSPSAMPATWNEGGCRQVPRMPRETKVDVTKRHACHVKRRWMSPSAKPARAKCATRASQVP